MQLFSFIDLLFEERLEARQRVFGRLCVDVRFLVRVFESQYRPSVCDAQHGKGCTFQCSIGIDSLACSSEGNDGLHVAGNIDNDLKGTRLYICTEGGKEGEWSMYV